MALLAVGCLLLGCLSLVRASDCDLGAADVIFLVKAGHLMQREDFSNVKEFIKSFSETLDIGRDNTTTHVGVVFFDNIGPPQTRIPLTAYGRVADLQQAIDNLSPLPCGADWCKEKETSFRPALDYAMSRFSKGRMKKLVLLHTGRDEPSVASDILDLTGKDPWLRALHIFIKGNIMPNDAEGTYLTAYHDPYKRYAARMAQLYPNVTVPIPLQPTPIPIPQTVEQGRITTAQSESLLKLNEEVCQQLFSCPPCAGIIGGRDPFDKETPLHSKLPQNFMKTQVNPATKKVNHGAAEDYEYEITADPPGLKINMNPALKNLKNRQATTTPVTSVDYVYEDNIPSSQGMKRSKRAAMSPRQKDCTCKAPLSFNLDTAASVASVVEKTAEGCSGSTSTANGDTGGCGGSGGCGETGGCGGTSSVSYQPAQYYQYYYPAVQYPQYQQYYPQYTQQYISPCSPCQQRNWYYPYQNSPCARSPCSAQYLQYPYYSNYIDYTQPQPEAQSQVPAQTQPQAQTADTYATPSAILPNLDAVHDGVSQDKPKEKKTEGFKFDSAILEKLSKFETYIEKDEKPTDPFNARAFGGSQLKRIPTGGLFDSIITPAPPPIDSILDKFPEPLEESEATIPTRPMTMKPVDIGSSLSEVEDLTRRKKRTRRSLQWGLHPWHYHLYNHFYRSQVPAYGLTYYWSHSARVHAAPLYSPMTYPATFTTTAIPIAVESLPCEMNGTDVVIYVDDVYDMKPSEFNTVKFYIKQVWSLLNKEPTACQEMSRMAVMKTSKSGDVIIQSDFIATKTSMAKEVLIDYMEYNGCSTRKPICEQAFFRALIMASNLLSTQPANREKLVIVISSRPSSSLERHFESLIEARDYVAQNKANLIFVTLREDSAPIGMYSSLQHLLTTVCMQAPTKEKMEQKKKYCPWSPLPIISRAKNTTRQIFG